MGDPSTERDPAPSSTALLALAQAGDPQAFARLVDPLAMRLLLFLRRRGGQLLGADCDEEDLLQLVLLRAWHLLPRFESKDPSSLYRWLVALGDGAVRDRYKYQQAKGRGGARHLESAADSQGRSPQPYDPRTSVSKVVSRREEYELADRALKALDEKYRLVVEGHLLEAKPLAEVARDLEMSKNAVWERYHRGMKQLGDALRPVL